MSAVLGPGRSSAPPWVRPTARLISWPAVVVPLAALTVLARALRAGEMRVPSAVGIMALAGLAAAVAMALDDPAHQLTAALPVGRRRRVVHRLSLAVPVAVGGWALAAPDLLPGVRRLDAVTLLVSMASVAVAVAVVAEGARPGAGTSVGVATPFVLVAADSLLLTTGDGWSLLEAWADHPLPVAAAAVATAATALRR